MDIIEATRFKPRETFLVRNPSPSPDYSEILNLVSTTVGENISFPGDIVVQILYKLPLKSLVRFKAVCKPWKSLINSPVFINIHLHRKTPQLGVLPLQQHGNESFPFRVTRVVASCNGLICFCTDKVEVVPYAPRKHKLITSGRRPRNSLVHTFPLVFYNPSTREFSFLPTEYGDKLCHPKDGFPPLSFCYLPQTQEYKLFSFVKKVGNTIDMKILTLWMNTKSFTVVEDIILPGRIDVVKHGATSGTSIFWLGSDDHEHDIVICYDAVEDIFSMIDVPPSSSISRLDRSLGLLKNSLSMLVQSSDEASSFDIWILVTDDVLMDKSWMKYRTVGPLFGPLGESLILKYSDPNSWSHILILGIKHDDGETQELFYYDLETNQVEHYKVTDLCIHQFVSYVESLVSLNSICSIY